MTVLLSARSITKSYGPRPLFEGISIDLRAGDRVCLIGPNGSGKSTLLKVLAGVEAPDSGTRSLRRTTRLGYLAQADSFAPGRTVEQVVAEALEDSEMEEYERAAQVGIALGKAGFADRSQEVDRLSGGWRKRLAIARALAAGPELLLIDEPTNHLDLDGVLWLEQLLENAPFAYLLVSHDRYFLEHLTNRVMELNRCYPEGYFAVNGVYSDFVAQRADYLSGQARYQTALASKVRREVEWLRRGPKARSTKAGFRVREAEKMIEDLDEVTFRNAPAGTVQIDFVATGTKANKLLVAEGLAKRLGDRELFRDLGFTLVPGTTLGLLGPNGSGKTTLLRLLKGDLEPDRGTIVRRDGLRVVSFDQDRGQLDPRATLRRSLAPSSDTVVYRSRPIHIASWAKRFLFRPEQLDVPVGDLSGGEQARILIARLMVEPADVLLLDEPTNDLDIPALEVLEEGLAEFPGAIVLVTHDRFMLDRLATMILGLDGRGGAHLYADFAQWEKAQARPKEGPPRNDAVAGKAPRAAREKPRRLSYQEQREWDQMEERIMDAEAAVAARRHEVEDAGRGADHVKLRDCCQELHAAQELVEQLYARWAELEARQR